MLGGMGPAAAPREPMVCGTGRTVVPVEVMGDMVLFVNVVLCCGIHVLGNVVLVLSTKINK